MAYGALQGRRGGERAVSLAGIAAALARFLAADRERWPLWLPVAFGLGIAIYFQLAAEPAPQIAIGLLAATALLAFWARGRGGAFLLALLLLAVAAGFANAQLRTWSVAAPALEREVGPAMVLGRVISLEPHDGGWRVLLEPQEIGRLASEELPEKVRINLAESLVPTPQSLVPDSPLRVLAVLRPPPGPSAPGAFDFARMAYFERLGAVGYAVGRVEPLSDMPSDGGFASVWRNFWNHLRRNISARVQVAFAFCLTASMSSGVHSPRSA